MPRLPDWTAVGEIPSLRSGRDPLNAPAVNMDTGASAIGRGVKKLGAVATEIGADMQKEQDALDLIKADAHHRKHLMEAERTLDEDPDYENYDLKFQPLAGTITDDAAGMIRNPALREKWALKADSDNETARNRLLEKGGRLRKEKLAVDVESALDNYKTIYSDPKTDDAGRDRALKEIEAAITLSEQRGLLTPKSAANVRDKYIKGTVLEEAKVRLMTDPDGLRTDLTGRSALTGVPKFGDDGVAVGADGKPLKGVMKSSGSLSPSGEQFIRDREGFTDVAKPDGRQYSSGYGTKAQPGESITREEAEKRLRGETQIVDDWIKRRIKVPLTQEQHDSLVSFGFNLGTDDLDKLAGDINAGKFERVAERMLSFNNFEGKPLDGLTRRRAAEAEMFLGKAPSGRYGRLSPLERAELVKDAQTRSDTMLAGRRSELKQQLEDDIESIRNTGKPRSNLELDIAERVLEDNQIATYKINRQKAQMEFDATDGMDNLDDAAIEERLSKIVPKGGEEGYAMKAAVHAAATQKRNKIRQARNEDPAMAVNNSLEVKAAAELGVGEDLETRSRIIRARLDAQTRLGINELDQRVITMAEAKALLDMPANITTKEGIDVLRSAAARAEQTYGPYARQAFDAAVDFYVKDNDLKQSAAALIAKMARGEKITKKDERAATEIDGIDAASKTFAAPAPVASRAPPQTRIPPTPQAVEHLINNPQLAALFDAKYGAGSAATALAKR